MHALTPTDFRVVRTTADVNATFTRVAADVRGTKVGVTGAVSGTGAGVTCTSSIIIVLYC